MATRIITAATPLAASLTLHVLVYALLLLSPPWPWPSRAGLTAELVAAEEPAPLPTPPLLQRRVERSVPPVPRPARPLPTPGAPSPAVPAPPAPASTSTAATPTAPGRESSGPAPSVVVAPPDTDAAPASAADRLTTPPEGPVTRTAASTATNAFDAPSTRSSSAPTMAALPSGEPSRHAIPRGGYQVKPAYPLTARRLGIEGTVLLGVFVDSAGRVAEVVVRRSGGHPDLDRAAADAVKQWEFEPARRGQDAIAMWVEVPVQFRLR